MEVVYGRCCGIDVHKKMIVACLKIGRKQVLREYGTMTQDLRNLTEWLVSENCQMIAMESTGSYWKPLYNIFELNNLNVMVVNAAHMKNVPGRKTDVKDAEWIANLLQHGLLKSSYIPDREQRELREITRYRKKLIEERSREINRIQKVLEGANIKLSSIVSDITGLSSRNIINGIIEGHTQRADIEEMVYGSMRNKLDEIMVSIDGIVSSVQKVLLRKMLDHMDYLTRQIESLDDTINGQMKKYEKALEQVDEIPGIGKMSAQTILAEIGIDMSRFPRVEQLCSWAGLSPGNNESAGKRKTSKLINGNKIVRTTLIQCAQTAIRKKDTFYHAQYQRLVVRRGKNRAIVAVAHSMMISIYYMLKNGTPYKNLGADYYNNFNKEKKINAYLKKLQALGCDLVPA